ncbi:MAG: Lar family restriction alleviation protein [Burkholderiales bacterium]|nr:Lar family restriction alleviation protein [Burkholderiales bacterium]
MSESKLKQCPFCGAGETVVVSNGQTWLGTRYSEPTSVSVRHWCERIEGQPSRMIERIGRDETSAIQAWNMRAS